MHEWAQNPTQKVWINTKTHRAILHHVSLVVVCTLGNLELHTCSQLHTLKAAALSKHTERQWRLITEIVCMFFNDPIYLFGCYCFFLGHLVAVGRMVNLSYWKKPIIWQPLLFSFPPLSSLQNTSTAFPPHYSTLLVLYFFTRCWG